jgi:hypothetical protein
MTKIVNKVAFDSVIECPNLNCSIKTEYDRINEQARFEVLGNDFSASAMLKVIKMMGMQVESQTVTTEITVVTAGITPDEYARLHTMILGGEPRIVLKKVDVPKVFHNENAYLIPYNEDSETGCCYGDANMRIIAKIVLDGRSIGYSDSKNRLTFQCDDEAFEGVKKDIISAWYEWTEHQEQFKRSYLKQLAQNWKIVFKNKTKR